MRAESLGPAAVQPARVTRDLLPRHRRCPASERVHLEGRLRPLTTGARGRVQRRRLLRPVRSHQGRPQGLRRRSSGAHEPADLRRAPAPRPRPQRRGSPAISIGCRTTRTCRWTSTGCPRVEATLRVQRRPQLARLRGRRNGHAWSAALQAQVVGRRGRAEACSATYDRGLAAAAAATPRSGCASAAGLLAARPRPSRSPTSSSADSATTTSITATRSGTASPTRFPAQTSTRSAAATS